METRVKCSITMPPGRVWLRPIACNVNFNGGAKDTTNALPDKSKLALPACRVRKPPPNVACASVAPIGTSKPVCIIRAM